MDMAKAYDRVDWVFLNKILMNFGFFDKVCQIILECVKNAWFSIMMNTTYRGFFKPQRGLRQGHPLSLYLFILIEEMLSQILKKTLEDSRIEHYFHPRGCSLVSHLLYADDMLLFVNRERRSLQKVLKTLTQFEEWSSQLINKEKSAMFMSNKISNTKMRELIHLSCFSEGKMPTTYLDASLASRGLTAPMLEPLVFKKSVTK